MLTIIHHAFVKLICTSSLKTKPLQDIDVSRVLDNQEINELSRLHWPLLNRSNVIVGPCNNVESGLQTVHYLTSVDPSLVLT